MPDQIFISYRRNDTRWFTTNLYEYLVRNFPKDRIFMDIDNIPYGADFVAVIEQAVNQCDVLLAVIGPDWINIKDKKGSRMIDNPNDFVRIELVTALKRNIKIIPILVDDTLPLEQDELPDDLIPLARLHAFDINHNRLNADIEKLIQVLKVSFTAKINDNQSQAFSDEIKLKKKGRPTIINSIDRIFARNIPVVTETEIEIEDETHMGIDHTDDLSKEAVEIHHEKAGNYKKANFSMAFLFAGIVIGVISVIVYLLSGV